MGYSGMLTGRWNLVLALLICAVAAVLRIVLISDRPIWFDEAFSWTLATEFGPAEIVQRTGRDVHPPLYYLLLSGWTSIFGESLCAMRSLSVILGTSTVFVAWLVGLTVASDGAARDLSSGSDHSRWRWGPEQIGGLIFSGLVATSAFQIRWSGEVRMYALLSLLFLLATWFAVKAVRCDPERKRWWIAFSLSCAAMMYTHNYGLFSVIGLSAFVLLDVFFQSQKTKGQRSLRSIWLCLAAIGGAGILYLPWLPMLFAQKAQVAEDYWMSNFSWRSLASAWDHLFVPENRYSAIQTTRGTVILSVLMSLLLIFQFRGNRFDRFCFWVTMTPIVLAILISNIGSSIIGDRLFVLAHLGALLTITRAMVRWLDTTSAILLAILLMADGLYLHARYQTQLDVKAHQGIRAAMKVVNEDSDRSIPVIVLQPCLYFSARYYAEDRSRVQLCTLPENIRHYTGGPILRPEEVQGVEELANLTQSSIWVLTSTGYTAGYSEPFTPKDWVREQTEAFPAVYGFEGSVRLSKYRRFSEPEYDNSTQQKALK